MDGHARASRRISDSHSLPFYETNCTSGRQRRRRRPETAVLFIPHRELSRLRAVTRRSELVILGRDGKSDRIDVHTHQRKPAWVQRLIRLLHEIPNANSSDHQLHFPPHHFFNSPLFPAARSPSKPRKPVHRQQKPLLYRLHLHSNRISSVRADNERRTNHSHKISQETNSQRRAGPHNYPIFHRHLRCYRRAVCERGMEDAEDGDEGV